jgi:sporulation protein YlmC with PRC-barrel domain
MTKYRNKTNDTLLSRELIGREVFSQKDASKVGVILDLMIDPNLLKVSALVTMDSNLSKRDLHMIPSGEVKTWGHKTVILVSQADVIRKGEELPECKKWLSVSSQLIGQDVITTSGKRLGELEDLSIDEKGRIVSYGIKEAIHTKPTGYQGKTSHIPSMATHQLGSGVLLVNEKDLAWVID